MVSEYYKKYYQQNKEAIKEYFKKWVAENREKVREYQKNIIKHITLNKSYIGKKRTKNRRRKNHLFTTI